VNLDVCVAHLDYNWERLKTLQAKYGDHVRIHDPGLLGSVLISSESNKTNARQMAKECGIELLDDYFKRALACRRRHRQGKRA
jgi:hypothetical protein